MLLPPVLLKVELLAGVFVSGVLVASMLLERALLERAVPETVLLESALLVLALIGGLLDDDPVNADVERWDVDEPIDCADATMGDDEEAVEGTRDDEEANISDPDVAEDITVGVTKEVDDGATILYMSRRKPAPQYSKLLPAQGMLQSDREFRALPALGVAPQ